MTKDKRSYRKRHRSQSRSSSHSPIRHVRKRRTSTDRLSRMSTIRDSRSRSRSMDRPSQYRSNDRRSTRSRSSDRRRYVSPSGDKYWRRRSNSRDKYRRDKRSRSRNRHTNNKRRRSRSSDETNDENSDKKRTKTSHQPKNHGVNVKAVTDTITHKIVPTILNTSPPAIQFPSGPGVTNPIDTLIDLSEIEKRRARVAKFREEKKKESNETNMGGMYIPPVKNQWKIEEESDDEAPANNSTAADKEEEEEDPLDAFMAENNKEVEKLQKVSSCGIAVKSVDPTKKKGKVLHNDDDHEEYSDEEKPEELEDMSKRITLSSTKKLSVDHSKIYYRKFNKDFYREVAEIAKMSQEEVDEVRKTSLIKVQGKNCPKPILIWPQCVSDRHVLDCLAKHKLMTPLPIQAQALPCIMSGRDVIGIAQTGSGKTLAFLLPMFRHIRDQETLDEGDGPIALILTPSRELAIQIAKEARKFAKGLDLHVTAVIGGADFQDQINSLKRGCEIVVCTPGRMVDALHKNNGKVTNLRRCTYVVIDEADRMHDEGFEPQVNMIIDCIRPERQTVMFSATFPRTTEALARKSLQTPIQITVGRKSVVCSDVIQHVEVIHEEDKFFKLLEVIGRHYELGSLLVFVSKQEHADDLVSRLNEYGYNSRPVHGGIDQYDRNSTVADLQAGKLKVVVATSALARGLDVKNLVLVINYDCPNHKEEYVHRLGRTGRAGKKGWAYTFITSEEAKYARAIISALQQSNTPVPLQLQEMYDDYAAQAVAQGKKVHSYGGFGGTGYKFDEEESQAANDQKKLQKTRFGYGDSDGEEGAVDFDEQIEQKFASVKRVVNVSSPLINTPTPALAPDAKNNEGLAVAEKIREVIEAKRRIGTNAPSVTQQATSAIFNGGFGAPAVDTKTIAVDMCNRLNARLGHCPTPAVEEQEEEEYNEPAKNQGPTSQRHEVELNINDFPQLIRHKITSTSVLAQVSEVSGAGISVRGKYLSEKEQQKSEEKKLFLNIESTCERKVQLAAAEIKRLIKEYLVQLSGNQTINKGRYKV